ncbi:MAG: copper resistance protein CopC/CopD [Chloroflexia bacterium]|nr:copper resistance protein CopC/CopD [Chloroflexia bacterium]
MSARLGQVAVPKSLPISWLRYGLRLAVFAGSLLLVLLAAGAPGVNAHASLERAEPPIDGIVIAPPTELQLFFTEEVAAANPAPAVQILNQAGAPQTVSAVSVGQDGDLRTVTVAIDDLDTGTYTVDWTVRSATDGHILTGTYAIRVGGGIPPGIATVDGELPAPWAVATRWLTFVGIAAAAAGFLFGPTVLRETIESTRARRRRLQLVLGGAILALLASLAEPLLQSLFPPENVALGFTSALAGLPDAWWFRPICLGVAVFLALGLVVRGRGRIPASIGWFGALISLLALAGLSLTSHAAGRETWREVGIASNLLHQVTVALWVGGLVHLALWWLIRNREGGTVRASGPLRRFSVLALPLFAVALATGFLNTGFVFPIIEGSEEYGFGPEAFSTLWTSNYGYVLITKLLLLLLPFGLAIYHRRVLTNLAHAVTARLGRTVRLEAIAVLAVVLGGSAMALSAPPAIESAPLESVVLAAPAYTGDGEMTSIVHLGIAPAEPGDNVLTLRLTDLQGAPVPANPPTRIALEYTSLDHGTTDVDQAVTLIDPAASTYTTEGLELSLDGWWRITATLRRQATADQRAELFLLLPDPNVQGFSAPARPQSSPEALAVFERGLAAMTSWTSVRVTERITSGSDALVMAEREITTGANGQPPAQQLIAVYAGGFAPQAVGELPAAPRIDFSRTVTIGEQGWQVQPDGAWLETPPSRAEPPSEWRDIYVGAEDLRLGPVEEELNGEAVRIVTFRTPDQRRQSGAWFAWWVGTESGNVYRATMVANQHYMVWEYTAIDEPFVIEGPPA